MAKAKSEKRNPRLLRRGDVVRLPVPGAADEVEEVVREVSIIVHLANGADVHVPVSEEVSVVLDGDFDEAMLAQLQAIQASESSPGGQ